jgi:hypothetical protein
VVRGVLVDGGAQQRVAEPDVARPQDDDAGAFGRGERVGRQVEALRDLEHGTDGCVVARGCRDHEEGARGRRQGRHLLQERRALAGRERHGDAPGEVLDAVGGRTGPGQLDQRSRVAPGGGHRGEAHGHGRRPAVVGEQCAGGVLVERVEVDLGQAGGRRGRVERALGAQQGGDGAALEPADREPQCGRGRRIDVVEVVDHHEHGSAGGSVGEHAGDALPDGEVVALAVGDGERCAQRRGLDRWQLVDPVEHGCEQRGQRAERHGGLAGHPGDGEHGHLAGVLRVVDGLGEQDAAPGPGRPGDQQRAARAMDRRGVEQRSDRPAFVDPAVQLRVMLIGGFR